MTHETRPAPHVAAHRAVALAAVAAVCGATRCAGVSWSPGPVEFEEVAGLTQPEVVAFNPEDDLTARVTAGGRFVVFVSERNGNLDIWVRDFGRNSTYPLTQNPADDFDPALTPDGERVVFVSRRSDAKGDLFLSSGLDAGATAERLTDASTQDRQPVVAPDGRRVFFTAAAGVGLEFIAELDLDSRRVERRSPTSGFDPAVSPDGRYLVYTAPATPRFAYPHLVALRLTDNATRAITAGEAPAGFAAFLPPTTDAHALAFVRFPDDDNGDGIVDARDQASLWRIDLDLDAAFSAVRPPARPYPLTDGASDELFPDAGDGQLYFTQGTDQQDILRLPPTGTFPVYQDPTRYLRLAEVIDDPRTRWFALRSGVARAGPKTEVGARALLSIGRLHLAEGKRWLARSTFDDLVEHCRSASPGRRRWIIGGLAEVEAAALDRAAAVAEAPDPDALGAAIRQGRRRIETIAARYGEAAEVRARIELEQAELLIAAGARTRAISALDAIAQRYAESTRVAARAMLRRIELLGVVHDPGALSEAYAQVTDRFPGERAVVSEAADRLVAVHLEGLDRRTATRSRVDALRRLVGRYEPGPIRRAARWRLIRELRASSSLDAAALELAQLLEESEDDRLGRARALRALAEVNEARGAGEAAVERWREVLQRYADLPGFASAARTAISRVNLAAAADSESRGDLEGARQAYARVIDNDAGDVEAHRRYLALSARLGVLDRALAEAERRAGASAGTPVLRYAYGLALTWRTPPDLDEALEEVEAAISINPQFTEAYLLRGWIRQMQELEEPSWLVETAQVIYERVIESVIAVFASDQEEVGQLGLLELAVEDFKTALRLNNESVKPRLEAEILLNLGNGHYRLADDTNDQTNMRQAFERYTQVVALGYRFEVPVAEMVFWERFGRAGSWVGAHAVSAMATRRALDFARRLQAEQRRLQQLGNLALAYDLAGEEAYAQSARGALSEAGRRDVSPARAAVRLREEARAHLGNAGDRGRAGLERVLTDLASARRQLDRVDEDPRELPTLWIALGANPTSAQYGFGPRDERNVNLALAELSHRTLGDIGRADALADARAALSLDRFRDVPTSALGFVNKWPSTLLQVRERLGLLMIPARNARSAGDWPQAWRGLAEADAWLEQTIDDNLFSGGRSWLWLERARWCATAAEWQAWATAEGFEKAPDEPEVGETLADGLDAVGRALALAVTATATEPVPLAAREARWTTGRHDALPSTLSTTTAVARTASVARSRPILGPLPRAARALTARLRYAEGLAAWATVRAKMRGPIPNAASTRLAPLVSFLDRNVEALDRARARFSEAARLAAGAGPGLGHRVFVLSLAAWSHVAPAGAADVAAAAEATAISLAEDIGEPGLAWSVRLSGALARGEPMPSLEGAWPGAFARDRGAYQRLLDRSAAAALADGRVADAFLALERRLALDVAAGPVVELDNRRAPDDAVYTRTLRQRLDALDSARRALAESDVPEDDEWRARWRRIAQARRAVSRTIEDGELRLSTAAQTRLLGLAQSAETLHYDLGRHEGILMPASVGGRLHLLFLDGAATSTAPPVHVATGVGFAEVQADLEAVWADAVAGRRLNEDRRARLARRLFAPLRPALADKREVIVVAGFLGRPVPSGLWPDGPVLTHLHAGTALSAMKNALQVGGRGVLRLPGAGRRPPLVEAKQLTPAEALEFRTPPLQEGAADRTEASRRLADRPAAAVLPDRVLDLVVVEAPLELEPAALERSRLTFVPEEEPADRFRGELPLGGLVIPTTTLVLGRTALGSAGALASAVRLDSALSVAGYASTIVVPESVPAEVVGAVLQRLSRTSTASPGAALAAAQRALRGAMPAVDAIFMVGIAGMDASESKRFAAARLKSARSRAVTALSRGDYRLAIPNLERWIRLQRAAEDTRRTEGIYGALVGVLRDKVSPPRPAKAADVQAELLQVMADKDVDEGRRADARIDLAHLLSRAHDFEAAEQAFEKALAVLERPGERRDRLARAWFFYGLHKQEQRAFEEAAKYLERSIALYEELGAYRAKDAQDEAKRALQQAGELYLNYLSDPVRARRAYERIKRYAEEPELLVSTEIDLARVARRSGDFIAAARHAETAAEEAVERGFVDLELLAEIEAANVAWYQGDYRLGQELCRRTLRTTERLAAELKRRGPSSEQLRPRTIARRRTFALSVCGLVAMSQRDFDGAVGYLEEARRVAERLDDEREIATQLNNLGRVYLEFGRLEAAIESFRRALAIDRRLDDKYALAYDLRNLGRALALTGVNDEAREALEKGLAYATEVRDANNELRARFALAQLDLAEGRDAAGAAGLRKALPLAERLRVKELEWQIHRYLGRLAWERGDLAGADAALTRAVRIARSITGRSAPSEFGPDRFEAFDDLMRIELARGETEAAFGVAEAARRLKQLELLSDRRLEWAAAGEALRTLRVSATASVTEAALARLEASAPRVAQRWRSVSPAELVPRIPSDAAILQYRITRAALVVFVMTSEGLSVRTLPVGSADVREAVGALGRQMSTRADVTVSGRAVAEQLLHPLLPALAGKRRLAFVLHDILRYVPLPALPLPDGQQVIDRFETIHVLEARAAVAAWTAPLAADGAMIGLGAAPPPPGSADRPLPFAAEELRVLQEEHPHAELVFGAAVTRRRLLRELAVPRRVLHFAGHSYLAGSANAGRLNDLLGGQLRTADGGVTVLDLLRTDVQAEVVVLSACSSLIGTTRQGAATGEDILSMAEGLHLAGARAVVGSTLNVDDVATALLMKRFYRALREQPVAAALRTAQQTARRLYGHPAWWAGFALWVGPPAR